MIPNAMPPFDFGLGETADALRDQVQRFAAMEVAPIASELDKTDRFPRELWPKMGELGLHGITVEEEYGGSGLGYLEHVIAVEELSRGSAAVGLSYGAHSNLCVNQLALNATQSFVVCRHCAIRKEDDITLALRIGVGHQNRIDRSENIGSAARI